MKRPAAQKSKSAKSKSSSSSKKDNDVYSYETDKIRNEKNRAGDMSDDSDGELKGDDESIDDDGSEVGWDSDDEMAYGHLFKNKKGAKNNSSSSAQDSDPESDQEEAFEGEMLLSDMFTSNRKSTPSLPSTTTSNEEGDIEDIEGEYSEDDDQEDEDDDEDDDDDDENDDDEDEGGDDDDDVDDDDEDEEGDEEDADAHLRLMNAIDKFSKVEESGPVSKRRNITNQSAEESIFSSVANDGAVSMDALLGALGEVKGLNVVKKQLIDLEKGTSVPAYVEKVVAERIERTLAYDGTALEMGKWQETVVANRHVRTLDLAQDKRLLPNYKDLLKKFTPTTDMEREVQMILVKTGATDELAEQREEDELGSRNFSIEEMKERQAELSKVKALMFYEQMKRHRLNKIKSKAYRRIRKRQKSKMDSDEKEALADLDPELAREEEEKEALRRVKERMDMKHKNTGKWARMALQHGHHDESLRMAYHESVQLGQELSKRINDDPTSKSKADDDSSDDENEFQTETGKRQKTSGRAAKEMLSVLEGAEDEPEATGKYKKLFEMDFMKRASADKKERAREEAQNILREIENMEGDSDEEADKVGDIGKKSEKDIAALKAAREQMKSQLGQSSSGMSLKGTTKKISVSGPISVQSETSSKARKGAESDTVRWIQETEEVVSAAVPVDTMTDNPWLSAPVSGKKRDSTGQKVNHIKSSVEVASVVVVGQKRVAQGSVSSSGNTEKKSRIGGATSVAAAVAVSGHLPSTTVTATTTTTAVTAPVVAAKAVASKERKPLLMQKSQEDLVQIAFAGPDLEADFQGFKDHAVDEELGINEKRNKILSQVKAGWGDWAGPGASGVSTKILNIRNKLLKKVEDETNEKKKGRSDTKIPNVMISDRRVKTAAKYKISDIPHPFTSREEYERSMQMPLGAEWNSSNVVKATSVPDILLRAGRIVQPLVIPKNVKKAEKKIPEEGTVVKKMNRTITGNKKHKK